MSKNRHAIEIRENYIDYKPPFDVHGTVKRLLSHIPARRLVGLKFIDLTNVNALNHKARRRKSWSQKRKVSLSECGGWYVEEWKGRPAGIKILVDNILKSFPKLLLYSSFCRDVIVSETLFHEVGHHIHKTQAPEHKEREDVAENWRRKLSRRYFWKRYWYIVMFLYPFKPIIRGLKRHLEKTRN